MTQSWASAVHPAPRLSRGPSSSSLKAFRFPKQQFGLKSEERSFCAEWCDAPGSGPSSLLSNYGVAELVCNEIMRVGVKHE